MTTPTATTTRASDQLALVIAELTLMAVSLAAVVGFERLFSDDSWRQPVIAAVIGAHLVAMALRRLPLPGIIDALVFLAVGGLAIVNFRFGTTTRWGLPTNETGRRLEAQLDVVIDTFPDAIAPTPAVAGFVTIGVAALWLLAGVADALAFRARRTLTALAPAAAIVVVIGALGSEERRVALLAVAFAAAAVFAVTHRAVLQPTGQTWLGSIGHARVSLARAAIPMALAAGVLTAATVPLVPGANESLVDLDPGGDGDPARVVISPLVDIRARLVSQQDVEVFQVRSDEPAYWRLTSLDTFDNQKWSSRADYSDAGGDLDPAVRSGAATTTVSQQYRIQALAAVWLPAAFQPTHIENRSETDLLWDPGSATLIVDQQADNSDDIEYVVESQRPAFTRAELAALDWGHPTEFDRLTELPVDFSEPARQIAADVTASATGPYETALALQNYFRDNFTYDIDVAAGHDIERIDDFLEIRVGYCEQFAGAFAAMARSLGLPSRVAVGFTWGDTEPDDPTLYRVRGEHAHAWPEVYVDGAGWVAFEPTPSRGAPAAGYTGVEPAQDESGLSPEIEGSTLNPPIPAAPPNLDDLLGNQGATGGGTGTTSAGDDGSLSVPVWLWVTAVVLAGAGAIAAALPRLRRGLRRRHHDRPDDPVRRRVLEAWDASVDSVAPLGVRPRPAETGSEFVARLTPVLGHQPDLARLAATADRARFSPTALDETLAADAESTAGTLATRVRERTTWWDRYRADVDLTGWRRN